MSWTAIQSALSTRLAAVSGVENVQSYFVHSNDAWEDAAFQSAYTVDVSGELRVHVWRFTRRRMSRAQCEDDDSTQIHTHEVEIEGYISLENGGITENTIGVIGDAIIADLGDGDDTLSGACFTMSQPQAIRIGQVSFYGILCNEYAITVSIEEHV